MTSNGSNVSLAAEELVEWILRERWPNHKKTNAQIFVYRDDIRAMMEEFGIVTVRAAVEMARTRCSYPPEGPELRKLMPKPVMMSDQAQGRDPNCPDCFGNGWKMIFVVDGRDSRAKKRAIPCTCKAAGTPRQAPRPNPEQCSDFIKEALRSVKTIEPPPDPARRTELEKRLAQIRAEKTSRREERELIPAVVLSREQMDARSAAEHEEIVRAEQDLRTTVSKCRTPRIRRSGELGKESLSGHLKRQQS